MTASFMPELLLSLPSQSEAEGLMQGCGSFSPYSSLSLSLSFPLLLSLFFLSHAFTKSLPERFAYLIP